MNQVFAQTITRLRKQQGLSQKQAAQNLGISQALLSHYEKGIRECGLDFIVRVADFYSVSTDYLLGHETEYDTQRRPEELEPLASSVAQEQMKSKRIVLHSLSVLYSLAGRLGDSKINTELHNILSMGLYHVLRIFSCGSELSDTYFDLPCDRAMLFAQSTLQNYYMRLSRRMETLAPDSHTVISEGIEQIHQQHPVYTNSLQSLIADAEAKYGRINRDI